MSKKTVPGEIAVVMMTNRPELLGLLRARYREQESITHEDIDDMINAFEEIMKELMELRAYRALSERWNIRLGEMVTGLDKLQSMQREAIKDAARAGGIDSQDISALDLKYKDRATNGREL